MKKVQMDIPTVQSVESVTKGQNKCSPDFQQPHDSVKPLEIEVTAKGINRELNEALNDIPSFFNPDLIPPQKETSPNNISINSGLQESFLSKLAEIDEGLSKLSVVSAPNYEGPRKSHSSHVTNEEVQETAKVCQGQGSENHAPHSEADTGQQGKNHVQQPRTWKRIYNLDVTRSTNSTASKEELVLPTKRNHEQLSHPNGLRSKKHKVSIEINHSILVEADEQPRPSQ